MPTTLRVSALSNQNVWVPVRSVHPLFPDDDLSSYGVEVAVSVQDPAVGDWKPAVWETTTKEINGRVYYMARVELGPGGVVTLTGDETYQVHVRLTTAGETPVVEAGTLYAY